MNFINDLELLERNIQFWINVDPENGKYWYNEANRFAYSLKGNCPHLNIAQICGVIAALSANTGWDQNKMLAKKYLIDKDFTGHICKDKALRIIDAYQPSINQVERILNGPKITPFFRNILNPSNDYFVTLDRHAINLACAKVRHSTKINYTPKRRHLLAQAYANVAKSTGLIPSQVQAITWCNYLTMG